MPRCGGCRSAGVLAGQARARDAVRQERDGARDAARTGGKRSEKAVNGGKRQGEAGRDGRKHGLAVSRACAPSCIFFPSRAAENTTPILCWEVCKIWQNKTESVYIFPGLG